MKYIVTDTETTGLDPAVDGIVEIAGVSRDGEDLLSYESLCNPAVPIGVQAMATHHIQESMLTGKPSPSFATAEMVQHLAGPNEQICMVAHNAAFDRGFIGAVASELNVPEAWICTYRCALHLWPDAPGHSNQVLRYWLGVHVELPADLYPHRALYDAIVTEAILQKMLETHTLEQLLSLTNSPVLLSKVRFGKHRDTEWKKVPKDYLQWVLKQKDMDADVRHTALYYLRSQGQLL